MGNAGWWAAPSHVTEIGGAGGAVDTQPSDLSVLRKVSQQLVFHYRAGGDNADNGIAIDRIDELDTCYADVMFARIDQLGDVPDRVACAR